MDRPPSMPATGDAPPPLRPGLPSGRWCRIPALWVAFGVGLLAVGCGGSSDSSVPKAPIDEATQDDTDATGGGSDDRGDVGGTTDDGGGDGGDSAGDDGGEGGGSGDAGEETGGAGSDGGGSGPQDCVEEADCVDACPPASVGCTCHQERCLPTCEDDDDCPTVGGGDVALECREDAGICVPPA